jgi:hypothetical protein
MNILRNEMKNKHVCLIEAQLKQNKKYPFYESKHVFQTIADNAAKIRTLSLAFALAPASSSSRKQSA